MRKKLAYWSGLIGTERREMRKFREIFCDTRQLFENFVLVIVKGIFFSENFIMCRFSAHLAVIQ